MKKKTDDMLPEYDLSEKKGVRGRYASAYRRGHSVRILDGEKVISDKYFAAIEPDVMAYFPDSRSINSALRKLIALVPNKT